MFTELFMYTILSADLFTVLSLYVILSTNRKRTRIWLWKNHVIRWLRRAFTAFFYSFLTDTR
jgi:threonine/homoserine/homoserine lactone efflux protein